MVQAWSRNTPESVVNETLVLHQVGAKKPPVCPATLQGYLAHKKQRPPGTLQQDFAKGHMVALEGGAFSL